MSKGTKYAETQAGYKYPGRVKKEKALTIGKNLTSAQVQEKQI